MRRKLLIVSLLLIFGSLIAVAIGVSNQTRLSGVQVTPNVGDFVLNTDQVGNTATLITGSVRQFHLGQDADAGGFRIANVAPGAAAGEAFVYGNALSSADLTGAFPDVSLTNPRVSMADNVSTGLLKSAGTCMEDVFNLPGAATNGVAAVTAILGSFGDGVVAAARISGTDEVTVRRCFLVFKVTVDPVAVSIGAVP